MMVCDFSRRGKGKREFAPFLLLMLSSAPILLAMEKIVEEEIDLRPYIEALLGHWIWIVAAGVGTAVLAFIISSLLPPTYEATALVAVTSERERIQFDPRFETEVEQQALQVYPELATSDELLQLVLDELDLPSDEVETVQQFRDLLTAEGGDDPSLIRLTVNYSEADVAAQIANVWAAMFVNWANDIYRDENEETLAFFEMQLADAAMDVAAADETLVAFQANNRISIIDNRLSALNQVQSTYLEDRRRITFLLQDITGLRTQLAAQRDSAPISLADQLAALNLQLEAFDAQSSGNLQLQIDSETPLTSSDRDAQMTYLEELVGMLEARLAEIEDKLTELEPEILVLQGEKQALQAEWNQLQRNVNIADETYTALARKVDEERITSQEAGSDLRLASRSAVPQKPVAPRRLVNTAVAGILSVLFSTLVVWTRLWWFS